MLGEPLELGTPSVVGVRMAGALREGVTATDLVLTLTELLRAPRRRRALRRVLRRRPLGALARRPRDALQHVARVRRHRRALPGRRRGAPLPARHGPRRRSCRSWTPPARSRACSGATATPRPTFSSLVELDLDGVSAEPRRPAPPAGPRAAGRRPRQLPRRLSAARESPNGKLVHDGSVVIAAITSCTNTSNPSVMVAAGLLARNAVARGLRAAPHVKTSLAPGSRVVTDYLAAAGPAGAARHARLPARRLRLHDLHRQLGPALGRDLRGRARRRARRLRRALGQSQLRGPHPPARARQLPRLSPARRRLRARGLDRRRPRARAARHRQRRRRRLPARPLAVQRRGARGHRGQRLARAVRARVRHDLGRRRALAGAARPRGRALRLGSATPRTCASRRSSRISQPEPEPLADVVDARCLVLLGDSVTTDHISPAGAIPRDMPAGRYLTEHGVEPRDFNSFGARRGNHEVMVRGHVRQHPPAQRPRGRPGGRLHGAPAVGRAAHDLRRGRALRGRERAARGARRQGVRLRARRATGPPRGRCCSASAP